MQQILCTIDTVTKRDDNLAPFDPKRIISAVEKAEEVEEGEPVDSCLDRSDWKVSENVNMAFSLQGLNNRISSDITRRYCLEQLYPYARPYLSRIKERTESYWSHHFSTVEIVGLDEASRNLFGQGIQAPKSRAFGLRALDRIRDRLRLFQEETGSPFNWEATPAEGSSHRLVCLDPEKYSKTTGFEEGPGQVEGVSSNSSQPPVGPLMTPLPSWSQAMSFSLGTFLVSRFVAVTAELRPRFTLAWLVPFAPSSSETGAKKEKNF